MQYQGKIESSFTMPRLNLNLKNFRWDSGLEYQGEVQSSFTMSSLNLNLK